MRWSLLFAVMSLFGCNKREDALVRARLEKAAARPVVKFDLGVPMLGETPEIAELIALGPRILPSLIRASEHEPARLAAYAVMALGRIGDARARGPLERLRAAYQAKPAPDEWDRVVIGQCNRAIQIVPSLH